MAHFLRRAAAAARISRYPSAASVHRLVHKESQVPPEVRRELNRIEEGCVRRHRELAADLAKLHSKVREDYSVAGLLKGPGFGAAAWASTISIVIYGVLSYLGFSARQMVFGAVIEMLTEVEAKLESVVMEKVGGANAGASVSAE